MRSYLLSTLYFQFGAGELGVFRAAHAHCWVVWESGAWSPPRIAFGGSPTEVRSRPLDVVAPGRVSGSEALAMVLAPQTSKSRQVTLGRAASCDFPITDATVSQLHLVFSRLGSDTWYVRDADSTNGSWLDGRPLPPGVPRALVDGAPLRAGLVKLTFHTPEGLFARLKKLGETGPTLAVGA